MLSAANLLCLFIVIPLAGGFLITFVGNRSQRFAPFLTMLLTLGQLLTAMSLVATINNQGILVYCTGIGKSTVGISLVLDGLSVFMSVIVSLVAFLIAVYSLNYIERFTSAWKFYALFLFMIAGMNGVIMTGDVFNLYVFLEIASIATIALIAFGVQRHQFEAAFKYAMMSIMGSFFILLAIALLYGFTSTLNMAQMAYVFAHSGKTNIGMMISVLFIMGFGLKAALVPFHAWLPDAHPSAPAPVSAMLSGVLIKAMGFYTLCRIFYNVIGVTPDILGIFMFLGTISMVIGGLLAIGQWDIKRLLACSSISQMGYVFLGLGLGTPLGILGAVFHIFNHSLLKSLLFLNAGAVEYATGTRDLKKLGGLSCRMPVTWITQFIGAMSASGIPPLGGFWSKLIIIIAAVQAGRIGYAFWAVVASLLTLAALMKVVRYGFRGPLKPEFAHIKEVPVLMRLPMEILALGCVLGGGLLIPGIRELFLNQAVNVILHGKDYTHLVLQHFI
jgi:multicomponent Na+:H+ antiporter subunit D